MIIKAIILVSLLGLAYQDYHNRLIDIRLLLILAGASFYYGCQYIGITHLFQIWVLNAAVFIFQLLLVTLIISARSRKWQWIPDQYLGWGDIFFILLSGLFFSPILFTFYYSISLLLTLTFIIIFQRVSTNAIKTIPLVSGLAIILFGVLLSSWIIDINLYTLF